MRMRVSIFFISIFNTFLTLAQPAEYKSLFPGTASMQDQFGITSHITWNGYDYDKYRANIHNIVGSGNDIVRLDFNSPGIGWETGKINPTIWDNVYSAAKFSGTKMLPIVYKPRYKKYTKDYGDSYKKLLNYCLERYGDNAVGWEIWNEMDQMNAEDGTAPPAEYLPLLRDAYRTIKGRSLSATVLMGAIGDFSKSYFEDLLKLKAADYFDVLSVHYYSAKNPPERIIPFYEKIGQTLSKYNVSKPVWLTETGYVSMADNTDADLFYTEVLPATYKQLGISCSKSTIGILYDPRMKSIWNQDNANIHYGFKSCQLVDLIRLKDLSVGTVPVLMVLFGEKFPKGYFEDLRAYVERGGTVVFPEGGAVLYYEWDLDTDQIKGVGSKYYKSLHINLLFPWTDDAKRLGVKKMSGVKAVTKSASSYTWKSDDFSGPLYLTDKNLEKGDQMMTIVEGTDGQYSGPVAACYKLNSSLKGNVIIQTRPKLSNRVSESLQAARMPRLYILSYALGVDKVFAYCLRDKSESQGYGITHSTMTPKPVFYTLKTLSEKMSSGSSRPMVKNYNNQYIASWTKLDGKKVFCVWSNWVGQSSQIVVSGNARYYDEMGKRIGKKKFQLSPSVTYIEGATSVEFDYD